MTASKGHGFKGRTSLRLNCYGVVEGDSMCQPKGSFEECPDIWSSYMAMQSCSSPMIACYKRGVRGKA